MGKKVRQLVQSVGTAVQGGREVRSLCEMIEREINKKMHDRSQGGAIAAGICRLVTGGSFEFGFAAKGKRVCAPSMKKVTGYDSQVTIKDKFHLGECTKQMSSLMLHHLISTEKTFSWDTKISDKVTNVPSHWQELTVADLITERVGVSDYSAMLCKPYTSTPKISELIKGFIIGLFRNEHDQFANYYWRPYLQQEDSLGDLELLERLKITRYQQLEQIMKDFRPSEATKQSGISRSNLSVALAVYLAELHCGKTYEKLIEEYVAEPLRLTSIGYGAPQGNFDDSKEISQPWGHVNNQAILPKDDRVPDIYIPGTGMHMSIQDWMKTHAAHILLARSHPKPFPYSPHCEFNNGNSYGAGWIINKPKPVEKVQRDLLCSNSEENIIGYFSTSPRWSAVCKLNIKYGIGVGVLSNTGFINPNRDALERLTLDLYHSALVDES